MTEPELKICITCPAFLPLTGEGASGVCRAQPPVVFQDKEYFRGSTRSMLFGAYPVVGTFPLVQGHDWCMQHPGNREFWEKGIKATPPAGSEQANVASETRPPNQQAQQQQQQDTAPEAPPGTVPA